MRRNSDNLLWFNEFVVKFGLEPNNAVRASHEKHLYIFAVVGEMYLVVSVSFRIVRGTLLKVLFLIKMPCKYYSLFKK